ncbi:MAG: transglutaminase family protein [Chitinophagaceae bacterium]
MPVYKIQHITHYDYDAPVIDSTNQIKIYPFSTPGQHVLQHDVTITGEPGVSVFTDYWGNKSGIFCLTEPHHEMTIESRLVVDMLEDYEPNLTPLNQIMALDFSKPDKNKSDDEKINEILALCPIAAGDNRGIADWANTYVYENFTYEKGITTINTTVEEILKHGKGVCQDFAHVLLQLLRTAGIPARYVSGYICPNKDGLRGEGATHAWVEVWLQAEGWKGIDPTNNIWVGYSHIQLAVGRDFNDCSPAKGTFKGMANQRLNVYVSVGYEDGHVFEEHTQVKMNEERVIVPAIIPKHFYTQQQQQQQQ